MNNDQRNNSSGKNSQHFQNKNLQNNNFSGRGHGCERGKSLGNYRNKSKPQCQVCGKLGHIAAICHYRFDQTYQGPNVSQHIANLAAMTASPHTINDMNQYPDLGASYHIIPDINNLSMPVESGGADKILQGNGQGLTITHFGHAAIHSNNKSSLLNNLLCVPAITNYLLSVSKFTSNNNTFIEFHPSFCVVKDSTIRKVLLKGKLDLSGGLYQLQL